MNRSETWLALSALLFVVAAAIVVAVSVGLYESLLRLVCAI